MSNEDFSKKFVDSINSVDWPEVPVIDKASFSNSMIIYETCVKQYEKMSSISSSKFSSMVWILFVIWVMWIFDAEPIYMLAVVLTMKMVGLVYSQLWEFATGKLTKKARDNVVTSLEKIMKNYSL